MINQRLRLNKNEIELITLLRQTKKSTTDPERNSQNNVLIIADLHMPFERKGYLEHCKQVYKQYYCDRVIFIGDIVDNHSSSYHESNPDGRSSGDELQEAIEHLKAWYKTFPTAEVVIGNHDRLIARKAFTGGLSKRWIKNYSDVLEVPNWIFKESFEYDGVLYIHGEGNGGINGALQKALNHRKSIVQGHFHTEAHIRWNVSDLDILFAMQVGSGIDDKSYAMEYAKFNTKKSIVSCAVVLNNGTLPIIIPEKL
jgi:metallophosphoesterase superfamily enzyme